MPFYPMMTAGLVVVPTQDGGAVTGTCFAYMKRHVLLTARHCIPAGHEAEVHITMPTDQPRRAVDVRHHPTSDLSVIILDRVAADDTLSLQVVAGIAEGLIDGGDFDAYGYPNDGLPVGQPVGRYLKGHFQRYFAYESTNGYTYFAGEMSVPAPAGTSGGPVLRRGTPHLEGIITTNIDSSILLDKVDEIDEGDKRLRIETHRVVTYGIAAMATGLQPWLAEQDLGLE